MSCQMEEVIIMEFFSRVSNKRIEYLLNGNPIGWNHCPFIVDKCELWVGGSVVPLVEHYI